MNGNSVAVEIREMRFFRISTGVGVALFITYFVLGLAFPDSPILGYGSEDGPVEYAGALFWGVASGIGAYRLIKGPRQPLFLLTLWTVLTFVFMGEEISWFQRVLGFDTPAALEQVNQQGEFNLHNLDGLGIGLLNVQNAFRLGFLSYFLVLPALTASSRVRGWTARLGYSVPDRAFLIMVWVVIGSSIVLQAVGPEEALRVTVESRESFYAFAVLVYVYLYLRGHPVRVGR